MKCEDCRYFNFDEGGCEYPDMPPCNEEAEMKTLYEDLRKIEREMQRIGREIRSEGEVMRRELEERITLNLTGQEAIKHYLICEGHRRWLDGEAELARAALRGIAALNED